MNLLETIIDEPDVLGPKLAARGGPIVVGPWLSEIGFEVLYWIPFLRWLTTTYDIDPARIWAVSRGGCEVWYQGIAGHYLDVFDWYSPRMFRAQNQRRVADREPGFPRTSTKQYHVCQFDLNIYAKVAWHLHKPPQIVHPAVLYRWFRRHWRPESSTRVASYTRVQAWAKPPKDPAWPDRYVALKFYTSPSSHEPGAAAQIQRLVDALGETDDMLLLYDETRYDDHGVPAPPSHPRLQRVPLVPRTNLATQTAVMAHATQFIGTYGGFSYIAPMVGTPALTVSGTRKFHVGHLDRMVAAAADVLDVPFELCALETAAERCRRADAA